MFSERGIFFFKGKESWNLTRMAVGEPVGARGPRAWEGPGSRAFRLHLASGGGGAPSDLAVNVASRGMKRARDRIQRALENYPRGFRRSEMWAENEIQI